MEILKLKFHISPRLLPRRAFLATIIAKFLVMSVPCAIFGAFLLSFCVGCKERHESASPVSEAQAATAKGTSKVQMNEIKLGTAQAEVAIKGAVMQVASAQIGYATTDPDVVVAEIWQGSGVAYTSWAVLCSIDGRSWQIFGEPSDIVVSDPRKLVQFRVKDGAKFIEVDLPASGKTIRLKLPR